MRKLLGAVIDPDARKMWRATWRYSAVGLEMGIAIGLGVAAGWWLGERYGNKTHFLLGGLALGIAVATRAIIRVARMGLKEARADSDEQKQIDETTHNDERTSGQDR